MGFSLDNYVDVATRLQLAFKKYPDLRIQETGREVIEMPDKTCFIRATVTVWRDAADPIPSIATACELYPGKTSFTNKSENENAYSSALGRALGYMGFGINKSIASRDEVELSQSRQSSTHLAPVVPLHEVEQPFDTRTDGKKYATPKQCGLIRALSFEKKLGTTELLLHITKVLDMPYATIELLSKDEASAIIESLQD